MTIMSHSEILSLFPIRIDKGSWLNGSYPFAHYTRLAKWKYNDDITAIADNFIGIPLFQRAVNGEFRYIVNDLQHNSFVAIVSDTNLFAIAFRDEELALMVRMKFL